MPTYKILREVKFMVESIELGFQTGHQVGRHNRWVTWHSSRTLLPVLNVDGSSLGNPSPVGFGGLLQIGEGEWIFGFYGSIGTSENLQAELHRLVCYSDSKSAIELSKAHVSATHAYAALILKTNDLLQREWEIELIHTLREGNGSADVLAKLGASQQDKMKILPSPPGGARRFC